MIKCHLGMVKKYILSKFWEKSIDMKSKVNVGTTVVSLMWIILIGVACSSLTSEPTAEPTEAVDSNSMENMNMSDSPPTQEFAPAVLGIYEAGEVWFIHTETSDPDVAQMLTEMMDGPEVILVPELGDAPDALLANVYVFTNGLQGMGPFGFQLDIFDSIPGDPTYRPLRNVNLVSWNESATARELSSVAEIEEAQANGEITVSQPGIVVNMPILVWPGGNR